MIIPLSNTYGRRPIYLGGNLLAAVTNIAAGYCTSWSGLLATRVFNGIGAGSNVAIGAATICDLYFLHERGLFMGVYTFFLTNGTLTDFPKARTIVRRQIANGSGNRSTSRTPDRWFHCAESWLAVVLHHPFVHPVWFLRHQPFFLARDTLREDFEPIFIFPRSKFLPRPPAFPFETPPTTKSPHPRLFDAVQDVAICLRRCSGYILHDCLWVWHGHLW